MENVLPTVVIVLAEIIAILVIALGAALYLHARKNRRHQAELNAVMGIARHAEQSAPARRGPAAPDDAPSAPADAEFVARTNQSIDDIREALARLDVKLGQFHHEDRLHDRDIDDRIKEEDTQLMVVRRKLHEVAAALFELKTQHATHAQDLHNLRVEIERHAPHPAPAGATAPAKPAVPAAGKTRPAPAATPAHPADATLIDDFTLPDSVLEELEEVAQSAAARPAAAAGAVSAATKKPGMMRAAAGGQKIPRRSPAAAKHKESAVMAKTGTVDEPQYAFDPARIEDAFNVPLFIPGAANTGINVEELDFEEVSLEHPPGFADAGHEQPNYDADRVFYQSSPHTGIKAGWYFSLRGGKTHGPFGNKEAGERVLNEMIEQFKRTGDSGGR